MEARFLGRTRIVCEQRRIEPRLSARSLLVLALLLCHQGELLDRKEVAFALWPDSSDGDARATLRRELYKIQRALPPGTGPWLISDARTVGWTTSRETRIDVAEFERLCDDPAKVERALTLYDGPFAPELDHEWASALRQRLARTYARALELAIKRRGTAGDLAGTLSYVEQLLAHDPWREDAVCGLILLRCRLGDRAGALSFYRDFRERLRAEFKVEPMPETAAYYQRMVGGPLPFRRAGLQLPLVAS